MLVDNLLAVVALVQVLQRGGGEEEEEGHKIKRASELALAEEISYAMIYVV
jgi:hypothetical protein